MTIESIVNDIKSKTIDPLLVDQAKNHVINQVREGKVTIEEVLPKINADYIKSGGFAKEAIRDAIRSVPVAGKIVAGALKGTAEIPALMLETPKALHGLSKVIPSPAELIMDTFAGRERVKRELDPVSQGLAQGGKFVRDLASDISGVKQGEEFKDLPTGLGSIGGLFLGGSIYAKAVGAATEGAIAASIFKDLTAKGITKTAAQAATKRFIAGTAANTIVGSPLSITASMDEDGNINPQDLGLNLVIDAGLGWAIEGAGALFNKGYGKQALKEVSRITGKGGIQEPTEGFIFRGNSKKSLKGIAETNRAINKRNVAAYKAKVANEEAAAQAAKEAAALKYEKLESDLMQSRALTIERQTKLTEEQERLGLNQYWEDRAGLMQQRASTETTQRGLAGEQTRLGLKQETKENVSLLDEMYESEKQKAFKQIDADQRKLIAETEKATQQQTKTLVKQKTEIDKQERTLTKPFDLEEKNLTKQQKQVNDSYQRAKKQAESESVEIEVKPLGEEEILSIPEIKEANKGLGVFQKDLSSQVKAKITNIKQAAKDNAIKLQEQLDQAKQSYEDFLAKQASPISFKNEPARRAAEARKARAKTKFDNYKKRHAEKVAKLKERVNQQIETVKTKQQQALEAKQTEINKLRADAEAKRLQDIEAQKQQIKEQKLKAIDDEYNAVRSDIDNRLSVTNANRNQAISDYQARKQSLLEQQQKLEQDTKDKIDYLNRRTETLKKKKEKQLSRQFKKDALKEYREKMGLETPVSRNADDIEVDRMIAAEELDEIDSQLAELQNKTLREMRLKQAEIASQTKDELKQIDSQLAKLKLEANPPTLSDLAESPTGTTLKTAETFFNDMQKVYDQAASKSNPEAYQGKNIKLVKTGAGTATPSKEKIREIPVDENISVQSDYQGDNPVMKPLIGAKDYLNDFIKPIIDEIKEVDMRIAGEIRKLFYIASKRVNDKMSPIANFQAKFNQFTRNDKATKQLFDYYFLTQDRNGLRELSAKIDKEASDKGITYKELPPLFNIPIKFFNAEDTARDFHSEMNKPLAEMIEEVFKVFDDLHEEITAAGREIGFRQDYLPTAVRKNKLEEWRSILNITPIERGEFDKALAQEKQRLGHELSEMEKTELLDKFLSGYRGAKGGIPVSGNYKERTGAMQGLLSKLQEETGRNPLTYKNTKTNKDRYYADLYEDPFAVMKNYVERSVQDIEVRKFFGKGETNNLQDNIGTYVNEMLANGQITNADVVKLKDALGALFIEGPRKPVELGRFAKDFSTLGALNDIRSSVQQLTEVGMAAYRNGVLNTIKGLGQALTPEGIKTLDVAVERVGVDYKQDASMIRGLTEMYLKVSSFKAMNKFMQEVNLNSSFNYFKKIFKKGKGEAFEREYTNLQALFGTDEANRMVQAFRTKSIKESYDDMNIGLALFERLAGTQVTSLADLPKAYLNNPDMRFFYTLKSFGLKQFQLVKNDVYSKFLKSVNSMAKEGINAKNIKEASLAVRNAISLGVLVGGANYGTNYLIDMLTGKTSEEYQSMEERIVEAALQTFFPFITPYTLYKFKKEGPITAGSSIITPAFRIFSDFEKDYNEAAKAGRKGEGYDPFTSRTLFNAIPIAGKTLYAHTPAGQKEYERTLKAIEKEKKAKEKNEREEELRRLRGY